jgi:hypothetical protein
VKAACDYRLIVTSNDPVASLEASPLARSALGAFGAGATVGVLGGLVGLGVPSSAYRCC